MVKTPIAMFNCPTRRAAALYPYTAGNTFRNCNVGTEVARSDYATCVGDYDSERVWDMLSSHVSWGTDGNPISDSDIP